MLMRARRLTAEGMGRVMRKGARYASASFFVRVLPGGSGGSRVGVVVGRKVAKKAARRNYYKRVLRHALRDAMKESEGSWEVALVATAGVTDKRFVELEEELRGLLRQAGVLNRGASKQVSAQGEARP